MVACIHALSARLIPRTRDGTRSEDTHTKTTRSDMPQTHPRREAKGAVSRATHLVPACCGPPLSAAMPGSIASPALERAAERRQSADLQPKLRACSPASPNLTPRRGNGRKGPATASALRRPAARATAGVARRQRRRPNSANPRHGRRPPPKSEPVGDPTHTSSGVAAATVATHNGAVESSNERGARGCKPENPAPPLPPPMPLPDACALDISVQWKGSGSAS